MMSSLASRTLSSMTDGEYREALVAISAVAAVVWSGGLIAYQIKRNATRIFGANEVMATAFVLPLIALMSDRTDLQIVGLGAALAFGVNGIRTVSWLVKNEKAWRPKIATAIERQEHFQEAWDAGVSTIFTFLLVIGFWSVSRWPTLEQVSRISILSLIGGYRLLVEIMYNSPDKK